jgi:uncharacterized protein (TIGR02246 family)
MFDRAVNPIDVKALVTAAFKAIEAGDVDLATSYYAPDAVLFDPVGQPPSRGHAEIRAHTTRNLAGVREVVEFRPDHIVVRGDRAAAHWRTRCRLHDGTEVAFAGISVLTVDGNGLLKLVEVFFDPAQLPDAHQPDAQLPAPPSELDNA